MNLTATVDATRFNDQMARLKDALIGAGKMGDAATVVQDEARRFVQTVMRFTPPKTLAQGRKAVARDIRRAMTPVEPKMFTSPKLRDRVREILSEGEFKKELTVARRSKRTSAYAQLVELMDSAGGWKKWRVERFDSKLHTKVRDNRGRVQRAKRVLVMEANLHKKYVADVQKRVGTMKSGWAPALRSLGGANEIPSWVARHTNNPGFVVNNIADSAVPSVTIGNTAKGVGQLRHFVQGALDARANAMGKRIRLILSGYAKDVAQGIRVSRKARNTGGD